MRRVVLAGGAELTRSLLGVERKDAEDDAEDERSGGGERVVVTRSSVPLAGRSFPPS